MLYPKPPSRIQIRIPLDAIGTRLDRFLLERCSDLTHSHLCRLIRKRTVRVSHRRVTSVQYRFGADDRCLSLPHMEVRIPNRTAAATLCSDQIDLRPLIIFEDEHFMAVNKPSGIPVQGGSGVDLSIDTALPRPSARLVHRLDRGCSGVLILAKSRPIARVLAQMFQQRSVQKHYVAWVSSSQLPSAHGIWTRAALDLVQAVSRRGWEQTVLASHYNANRGAFRSAMPAISSETRWRWIRSRSNDRSLLELMPITGRKHQLRSLCAFYLRAPIVGDRQYGGGAGRLLLHCSGIRLPHPVTNEPVIIEAPLPAAFLQNPDCWATSSWPWDDAISQQRK